MKILIIAFFNWTTNWNTDINIYSIENTIRTILELDITKTLRVTLDSRPMSRSNAIFVWFLPQLIYSTTFVTYGDTSFRISMVEILSKTFPSQPANPRRRLKAANNKSALSGTRRKSQSGPRDRTSLVSAKRNKWLTAEDAPDYTPRCQNS